MAEFQNSLSYESWDQVFDGDDVNKIFNSFLNTYLRIFYASFPFKKINTPWIIKPLAYRKENCTQQAETVQTHILKGIINVIVTWYPIIKEAKKAHYDNQIKNSTNKNKTTWNIVNKETHRKVNSTNIKSLNIDGITTDNQQLIAETSNNYFISIAENIRTKNRNAYIQNKNTPYNTKIDASPQHVKEVNKSR